MDPPPGATPPMRMAASWSESTRIDRIQARGASSRARWRAPLGSFAQRLPRCRHHEIDPTRSAANLALDTHSPIQAEHELVEIGRQVLGRDRAVVGAEQPALGQAKDQVDRRQAERRVAPALVLRLSGSWRQPAAARSM